jgi:Terpene synthase family 2, C-terminal metal binding
MIKEINISLESLEQKLPSSWCDNFSLNPATAYRNSVFSELVAKDVIPDKDKSFKGFSGVPRYFHPFVENEGLALSLKIMCWYFYFDDPFDYGLVTQDSTQDLIKRMIEILKTREMPANPTPAERICGDFLAHAEKISLHQEEAFERFVNACCNWVESIIHIDRRNYSSLPSLEAYKHLRVQNVGILPEYPLNEIICKLTLEQDFVTMPEIIELGKISAWIVAQCNDIYSFESEAKHGTQMNSLEIRKIQDDLDLEEAYESQVTSIDQNIREFINIEANLIKQGILAKVESLENQELDSTQRDQTKYVQGMHSIIIGNHFWSLNDGRYSSDTSPFLELRS